jgi:hypothetical protein
MEGVGFRESFVISGSAGDKAKGIFYTTVCRKGSHPHGKPWDKGTVRCNPVVTLSAGSDGGVGKGA